MAQVVKNLPANAGDIRDAGSIPGSGRSPGGAHGTPLQYSCLENSMDRGFPNGSAGKESACNVGNEEDAGSIRKIPGGGNGNHSSLLTWEIPWTEGEPGRLKSMGSQRVRRD